MAFLAAVVVLVLGLLGSAGVSFIQRTCPIDPAPVEFPPVALSKVSWTGEYDIGKAETIVVGEDPEDIAVDDSGAVYTGLSDRWIKRIGVDGSVENVTRHDGGPILGLAVGPAGNLYIADADKGLFVVSKDGTEKLLSSEADGVPFKFTDGIAVAKDGVVYFTDASSKYGLDDFMLEFLEGRPNGRLLKYDPTTSTTTVLATGLSFPNGAALSEDEDFVLVCETSRARILRYWLKGEKAGILDTFHGNLPGYPDNIRFSPSEKIFYIGISTERDQQMEGVLGSPSKLLRCFIVNPLVLKLILKPKPGLLITIDGEGKLLSKYADPSGKITHHVTGGLKVGDFLYITSLQTNVLARIKL